ncbi:hypothetical protein AHAT_14100 [Agarivorans sp. Toyoura001]|nr:hypothetical protein AHAT_14100 [Agarivorans sp. Toyoura001]
MRSLHNLSDKNSFGTCHRLPYTPRFFLLFVTNNAHVFAIYPCSSIKNTHLIEFVFAAGTSLAKLIKAVGRASYE